ncbi:MAG: hypothetical protein HYV07_03810 [Deltaproteobacteria bacterium]|nr:hypothetical protein [Deltaproteobacteria bacterium]
MTHREIYDLITNALERKSGGLTLTDAGLDRVAAAIAGSPGDQRAEALLGVLAAIDFLGTQKDAQPAQATLLAVFLTAFERSQLDEKHREGFEKRLREITGQPSETKVPVSAPRPEGTVPAGPAARFVLAGPAKPRSK